MITGRAERSEDRTHGRFAGRLAPGTVFFAPAHGLKIPRICAT
jgi:hypothetical protein